MAQSRPRKPSTSLSKEDIESVSKELQNILGTSKKKIDEFEVIPKECNAVLFKPLPRKDSDEKNIQPPSTNQTTTNQLKQ
jgi:hypothetical protein